jgi:hypothetical protein
MADATDPVSNLIRTLDLYLVQKAPFQIPEGGREAIVKYGPWIMLVFMVLSLPIILAALGIGAIFSPFGGVSAVAGFGLLTVFLIVELALEAMALPGLLARKMSGWKLLFYSRLVSLLYSLITFSLISLIIGGAISLYILFQVRTKYS